MARPLSEACAELGIKIGGEEALFLWNQIFDPRDVLDLMESLGLSRAAVTEKLTGALIGALKGWTTDRHPEAGQAQESL